MQNILTEISPLSDKDCFDIVDRHKSEFTYPLHRHNEYELNFVLGGAGVHRIVGDSIETIGEMDLVLIANPNIEHCWQQGECNSKDIREITIQFSPDLISSDLLEKNQFITIKKMFELAQHGISFPYDAILKVYNILDSLPYERDGFLQYTNFMKMMYFLSRFEPKILASGSFANTAAEKESRRVKTVKEHIDRHFAERISLDELAEMVGMSPSAFSRFFKMRTHKTVTEYITDVRLGFAARALVDTTQNISEICYSAGFNNISNFNRIFKDKKGMTPKDFRAVYKKNKVIV